jgi:AraC family transcriptional regulator of arabinose operon
MHDSGIPPLPCSGLTILLEPMFFTAEHWRWNNEVPDCFDLWIALEGEGEMKTRGNVYPIQPGTAFILLPHQRVSAKSTVDQTFRNFACRFMPSPGGEETLIEKADQLMGVPVLDVLRTKELCRAAVQSTHYGDALALQQSAGLCYQILAQVWRAAHTPARRDADTALLRLMDRLREQPSQRLSLEDMARESRLSVAQFSRRFLALSGEPPMRFAIRQRVQRAQQLLRGSSMQISEIADALGYVDVYFFSRQFKQATGVSPSTYRRDPSIGSDV